MNDRPGYRNGKVLVPPHEQARRQAEAQATIADAQIRSAQAAAEANLASAIRQNLESVKLAEGVGAADVAAALTEHVRRLTGLTPPPAAEQPAAAEA